MASKAEKTAIIKLLEQLETVQAWLDDTRYPRQSRLIFEEALAAVRAAFEVAWPRIAPVDDYRQRDFFEEPPDG